MVSPSVDNLLDVVQACGFDLPLVLDPRATSSKTSALKKNKRCSRPSGAPARLFAALDREGSRPWLRRRRTSIRSLSCTPSTGTGSPTS